MYLYSQGPRAQYLPGTYTGGSVGTTALQLPLAQAPHKPQQLQKQAARQHFSAFFSIYHLSVGMADGQNGEVYALSTAGDDN